uniref:Uncharacterized protein LOC101323398 n=2 Tax=Tursiops truncatus TaxID=9739 RepID=A0A6J3RSD5_TURTR|nr:uncharacterized protein LOC101323398 [Tursiops truncatus]
MYRPRWGTEEGRREAGWSGQAPRRQRRGRGRHKGGSPAERNRAGSEPWGGGGRRVRVRARGFAFPAAEGAWRCGPARRSRPRGRREKRRGGELERRPLPRLPGSGGGGAGGGITQVTFPGNQFAETIETAVLEEKEILHLDRRSVTLPSNPSPDAPS